MAVQRRTHRDNEEINADLIAEKQLYSFKVTLAGAAPHSIALADYGVPQMADANYVILPAGETVGALKVDESTITVDGFDLLGGADTEVVHILVTGTPA